IARLAEDPQERLYASGERTLRIDTAFREHRRRATPPARVVDADGTKTIYSAENTENLPGTRVRADGQPAIGDAAVDESYDSAGVIHDLFATEFGRDSMDGAGSPVV